MNGYIYTFATLQSYTTVDTTDSRLSRQPPPTTLSSPARCSDHLVFCFHPNTESATQCIGCSRKLKLGICRKHWRCLKIAETASQSSHRDHCHVNPPKIWNITLTWSFTTWRTKTQSQNMLMILVCDWFEGGLLRSPFSNVYGKKRELEATRLDFSSLPTHSQVRRFNSCSSCTLLLNWRLRRESFVGTLGFYEREKNGQTREQTRSSICCKK